MALEVVSLTREFLFKKGGKDLPLTDPDPLLTPDEVMKYYSTKHPELTNAKIEGPKVEGDKAVYKITNKAGQLG